MATAPEDLPKRLPLVVAPENRDQTTNRDAKIINGFIEQVSQEEVWVFKRPGMSTYSSVTAGSGLGIYNWNGDIYAVIGSTLYKNGVSVGTVDSTNGVYTFSIVQGGTPVLYLQNGVHGYKYNTSGGLVEITGTANYPNPVVKGQAYLDGTTYLMTTANNVRGSGINDLGTWDPLNSILAQIEPDNGIAVAKQLVYVVAFKQWTVEVFYDAGNSTGSPLGSVQGGKVNVGCRAANSVQDLEGTLFWVSQARNGSIGVYAMDNLKAMPISTPPVERLLEQADFSEVYSWSARISGHKFYAFTSVVSNFTLVYDMTSQRWYQWMDSNGNYIPIVGSTFATTQHPLLLHRSNGKIYSFDDMTYTDDGSIFSVDIYTPNYDGGTRRRKTLYYMDFVADQTNGSQLTVRKSDDDYQTWSNPRLVDLSMQRPRLTGMGTFRRRAFHFHHNANTPFRIKAVDLSIELGTL